MKKIITILLFSTLLTPMYARKFEVPADYNFKGQYEAYEKDIVRAIKWLASTAPDVEKEKRKEAKSFISKWIGGAPHVTVPLNSLTMGLRKVSGELYSAYLGGSIRKSIRNCNENLEESTFAGMKAAVKYYKKYKHILGENEQFEEYARLQRKGKLRQYLKDNNK